MFMRSPDVVAATLKDKVFLLHVDRWVYLELNESGLRIWELLEDGRTLKALVEALRREFDVPADICARDVGEIMEMLRMEQFVLSE
jgi:hypothetical protein